MTSKEKKGKVDRLQFLASVTMIQSIDKIAEDFGLTKTDIFRDGMGLLFEYVERTGKGYNVVYEKEGDLSDRTKIFIPHYKHLNKD